MKFRSLRQRAGKTRRRSTAGWPPPKPRGIAKDAIVKPTMNLNAGEFAPTADKEDTKLASVDTKRTLIKIKQPNKQVEQIRLPQRVRKIGKRNQERKRL